MSPQKTDKSYGVWITVTVIVVLAIIVGLYMYGQKTAAKPMAAPMAQPSVAPVSSSDDLNSLNADLNATDTGPNTSGLDNIQ